MRLMMMVHGRELSAGRTKGGAERKGKSAQERTVL